jgi:hypothetical protein
MAIASVSRELKLKTQVFDCFLDTSFQQMVTIISHQSLSYMSVFVMEYQLRFTYVKKMAIKRLKLVSV